MHVDALMFRTIERNMLMPGTWLSPSEATATIQLLQLAAQADLAPDAEQLAVLRELTDHLCVAAGIHADQVMAASPLPLDPEETQAWLDRLVPSLGPGARELAFVLAYVVVISNVELAPVETRFLSALQAAIDLRDERAAELVARIAELVTPVETSADHDAVMA